MYTLHISCLYSAQDSAADLGQGLDEVQSDSDLLEPESDTNEPELDLSSSSSDTDLQASGTSEMPRTIRISASEPVIHKPQRPLAPPRRPVIPPRPGNSSLTSLQEAEKSPHVPPIPNPRSQTISAMEGAGTKFSIGTDDSLPIDTDSQGHTPEVRLSPDVRSVPRKPVRPPRPNAPQKVSVVR